MLQAKQGLIVDYSAFEELVKTTYNQEYDFVASEELSNDTAKVFSGISGKVKADDQEYIAKFVATGDADYIGHSLLEDLCKRELIPPGNYVIKVSW